jgi:hypothetical protein
MRKHRVRRGHPLLEQVADTTCFVCRIRRTIADREWRGTPLVLTALQGVLRHAELGRFEWLQLRQSHLGPTSREIIREIL